MGEDEETWNPPPGATVIVGRGTPPQQLIYHASDLSHSTSSSQGFPSHSPSTSQGFPLNHPLPQEDFHNSVYNRYSASKTGYHVPTHPKHIQRPVPTDHQRVPTEPNQAPHRVPLDSNLAHKAPQNQLAAHRNPHDPNFADKSPPHPNLVQTQSHTATRLNSSGWPVPEPRKTPDFSKYMRRPGDKAEANGRIGGLAGHSQHYQASAYHHQSSYPNYQPQHGGFYPAAASAYQQQQHQHQLNGRVHQQYMPSTSGMYD